MRCSSLVKRSLAAFLLILTSIFALVWVPTSAAQDVVPGEFLVKPKVSAFRSQAIAGGAVSDLGSFMLLKTSSTASAAGVARSALQTSVSCESLMATGQYEYCEPNYRVHALALPNDPLFAQTWGLSSSVGIDAPGAWERTTGSSDVVVAIIDTGIDYQHEDLAANVWVNPGEIAGNGRDDDADGYVDDLHGYNFAYGNGDPYDDNGHGTHVAGTIGALGNNGSGVAGVNWNVKLLALKFLDSSGSGDVGKAVAALNYLISLKARGVNIRLANNSWGGGGYSKALDDAIARANQVGIMFIAAAGNEASNNDAVAAYPANIDQPNVISVAALDRNQNLASFSNYGVNKVDIAAPGSSIISTFPGNRYVSLSGTSMAAPHVTGALALLLSIEPNLSNAELKARLVDSGSDLASLNGVVRSGRALNVNRLITGQSTPPPPPALSCPYRIGKISSAPDRSADSGSTVLSNVDELSFQSVTLPFSFPFGGTNVGSVAVSPNGVLYFGEAPDAMDYEPGKQAPLSSLAALQTDLVSTVKVAFGSDYAVFYWSGRVYDNQSGRVTLRVRLNADGSIQEWVDFNNSSIAKQVAKDYLIGLTTGDAKSYRYSTKVADGLGLEFAPNCGGSDVGQDPAGSEPAVKTVSLQGTRSTATYLVPGQTIKVTVKAASEGAAANVTRKSKISIKLDGKLCSAAGKFTMKSGRNTISGKLPRGANGLFSRLSVKVDARSASKRILAYGVRIRKHPSRSQFTKTCKSLAASLVKK